MAGLALSLFRWPADKTLTLKLRASQIRIELITILAKDEASMIDVHFHVQWLLYSHKLHRLVTQYLTW